MIATRLITAALGMAAAILAALLPLAIGGLHHG
jgi:hypothetical protein